MAIDRQSPEFLRFYARVMLREARAHGKCRWMINAALRSRREAAQYRPAQGYLFA